MRTRIQITDGETVFLNQFMLLSVYDFDCKSFQQGKGNSSCLLQILYVYRCSSMSKLESSIYRGFEILTIVTLSSEDTAPAPPCRAIIIPSLIEKTTNSKLIVIMNLSTGLFIASKLTLICYVCYNSLIANEEDSTIETIFKTC